jgi:two-component system, NtrC family, response regulator HydG
MEHKYGSNHHDLISGGSRNGRGTSRGHAAFEPATLVAENHELAAVVSSQLRRAGCHMPPAHTFASVRELLSRDRDDTLLLLVSSPIEVREARELIQESSILKLPNVVLLMATDACDDPRLTELTGRVAHTLIWPRDESALVQILKSSAPRRNLPERIPFPEGSTEYAIARRLVTFTPSMLPLVEKLALAAEHDVTVLLSGETGTGKTFLAKLVHEFSPRAKERFLNIPCGALAPNLVESEFFGHVKGAFTGADRTKIGKFAAAGNGTLLLDEVDALGLDQQANLLRVVETGEYEPVGSTETQHSSCRLIVASNRNLKEEADKNRFRQDLYYRFNVMSFHLPPLRERLEDIDPLVRGFAARFNTKFRKDLYDVSSEAMAALESYAWPGNIRELENAIQHAVLVSQGPLLLARHLPELILNLSVVTSGANQLSVDTLVHNREVIERTVIQRALANHGFSRARAASELGISRVTLYKKMKKYGLMKDTSRPVA